MEIKHRMGFDNTQYREAKAKLPNPDGKHCIICSKDIPKYRRKYCSDSCWENWFQQFSSTSASGFRKAILKRDNYTCVKCGRTLQQLEKWYKNSSKFAGREMIVDHIIPIALDGKEFDKNNVQTLCCGCNAIKTREDIKKIARLRKEIKMVEKGENTQQLKVAEAIKRCN